MKTTIEIADDLFSRSRKAAQREGKTMRAMVEEGLRLALQARINKAAPDFEFPVHNGGGLRDEFVGADWATVRDAIHPEASRFNQ